MEIVAYKVVDDLNLQLQPDKVRREMSVSDGKIFVYVSISSLSHNTSLYCTKHIMLSIKCNYIYANYIRPYKYSTSEGR